MAKFNLGGLVDAVAIGSINEILGLGRSKDGISRPNRYEVTLLPPTGSRGTGMSKNTNIFTKIMGEFMGDGTVRATGLRCESIAFPGRTLDTTPDDNIYGPAREIVKGYSFGDVNATFQCSSDMKEKKYIETWQRLAFNTQTWAMGYYNDYVGSVQIHSLDEQDNKVYGVELVEAFPKSIGQQALQYGQGNNYQTLSVTFSYRYWKNLTDEADLPKALQVNTTEVSLDNVQRTNLANVPSSQQKL